MLDSCGGIFVARDGVHFAAVKLKRMDRVDGLLMPTVDLLGAKSLAASSSGQLPRLLHDAGAILAAKMGASCGAIGIAGFGPFDTLDRRLIETSGYGRLRPNPWHDLSEKSLPEIVSSGYRRITGKAPPCVVRSDVEAGAIGEAWIRGASADDVTAFLMLTEGIGGGFARGLTPLGGALHSEVGLVPVSKEPDDVLSAVEGYSGREWNLGLCANTSSLIVRARKLGYEESLGRELTADDLLGIDDERLWSAWHSYIAQVCITCTVILPPRWIILSGPLTKRPAALEGVRTEFRRQWKRLAPAPTFDYPELRDADFISLATAPPEQAVMPEVAGAIYASACHMCLGEVIKTERLF